MSDLLVYTLFVLGFGALVLGAEWLVRGAASVSRRAGVSDLVVGLTIVALGTSAPELVVAVMSALTGSPDLAVGNIVGSNLSNILLILGASALVLPLRISTNTRWKEIPFVLLSSVVLAALANDRLLNGRGIAELARGDGIVLLVFFLVFMYYIFSVATDTDEAGVPEVSAVGTKRAVLLVAAGCVALALGGRWIVNGATLLASQLGMSEALIGLTIVAVGTSLPELAASMAAARRGNADMAVGNVVGSNIMNVLWILGVTATITPIRYNDKLNVDICLLVAVTALFFTFTFTWKKHKIDRIEGGLFLLLYAGYLVFLIQRG